MCGIAGSVSTANLNLRGLTDSIAHRGPDDYGEYIDGMVRFEHRRLAIIDLSPRGHQPMISDDGNYIIVFNGEIYNHLDIRKRLIDKGYQFKSTSDTESLLYGYIEYGSSLLNQLNGIFAFAIHDRRKNEVFLGRDQYGVKPLYYYHKDNTFIFGSEIKSFLSFKDFDRTISYDAVFNYLQYLYCPGRITPFKYVQRLDAGHFLKISLSKDSFSVGPQEKYYQIPFAGKYDSMTESQWIDQLEDCLLKSVSRQLLSDAPLGFFLSGGLDSSLIVAMAHRILGHKDFHCFTISTGKDLVAEGFADDLSYAKRVAGNIGCRLTVIGAEPEIINDFDKVIWHLDEPQADPAAINVFNICRGARDLGIKVLLGGTAGDDVFSGYRRHQALRFDGLINLVPSNVRKLIAKKLMSLESERPLIRRIKKFGSAAQMNGIERVIEHFSWHPATKVASLFNPDILESIDFEKISNRFYADVLQEIPNESNKLNQMLYLELRTFLVNHNLNYTDKMSMAAGVEARVPYLDRELVDLSTRIPPSLKLKGNQTKYILKKVAERHLPKEVIYRSKSGFAAPIRKWMKNELRPLVAERLSPTALAAKGVFSPNAVEGIVRDNDHGKSDNAYLILALLAFDSWAKQLAEFK